MSLLVLGGGAALLAAASRRADDYLLGSDVLSSPEVAPVRQAVGVVDLAEERAGLRAYLISVAAGITVLGATAIAAEFLGGIP